MEDAYACLNRQIASHRRRLAQVIGEACKLFPDVCGLVAAYGCCGLFAAARHTELNLVHANGDQSWWGNLEGHLESGGRTWLEADPARYHLFRPSPTDGSLLRISLPRVTRCELAEIALVADGTVSRYSVRDADIWDDLAWKSACLLADASGKRMVVVPRPKRNAFASFDALTGQPLDLRTGKLAEKLQDTHVVRALDNDRLLVAAGSISRVWLYSVVSWPGLATLSSWTPNCHPRPRHLTVSSLASVMRVGVEGAIADYDLCTGQCRATQKFVLYGAYVANDASSGVCYVCQPGIMYARL